MSWWGRDGVGDVSAEFNRSLVRELLLTQQLRVKVLIVTAALFLVLLSLIDIFEPEVVAHVYQTGRRAILTQAILLAFILFEWWVHSQIALYLKRDRDVPPFRRYVSAFIETSLPSVVLILQIDSMGADKALGFVMPFAYFIFVISSTLRLDLWLSAFTGFVAAAELLAIAMHFRVADGAEPELYFDIARSVTILICGVLAGAVGLQLRRQFAASILAATARDRVTSLFGQHVSPQVVERLMAEGTSGATDIRRVAVMFADFRGFTAAAQSRTPQQVVDRLDGAFAVLVEKLEAHGGIVNKFLGDGFLALFGAPFETPDAARHAVAAGREMLAAMTDVNVDTDWPLRIGIGIHLGEVVAGSIGSPRRKEYTVIGDTVNFASRLEALNKEFGSQLLISSEVRAALGETECEARSLGEVPVRGYDHPVEVWQLG
ncbi:adenylate/guanylate cyclase domain-containing protein [Bradyrhizobium sp.]|jgi:adenylate cyclase|uniref:adenylate/guanylate cyclase domain-containing protein n=1 Tax=Bradyrhizobium sp. TaxID=376 RepID=UPI003C7C01B3